MTPPTSWQARVALTGAAFLYGFLWPNWFATAAMFYLAWRRS